MIKLRAFNTDNCRSVRTGEAVVRFKRKGANVISKTAIEEIGLTAGQKIAIVQDEDNPEDWYMVEDKNGFVLRGSKNSYALMFNNTHLAGMIIDYAESTEEAVSFKLITKPVMNGKQKLYPIIISSAKEAED